MADQSLLIFQSYLQIILETLPALEISPSGVHTQQAARLQELVEFIQSQVLKNMTHLSFNKRKNYL